MTTLKELIVKRPSRQFQYLHVLLDLSSHEKEKVTLYWPRLLKRLSDDVFGHPVLKQLFYFRYAPLPWVF